LADIEHEQLLGQIFSRPNETRAQRLARLAATFRPMDDHQGLVLERPSAQRRSSRESYRPLDFWARLRLCTGGQWAVAFVQRLRELGWIENRTVTIEHRWAEGRDDRFAEIAAEVIRLKVDVIVTYGTPSAIAAKKATGVIPIVIAGAGDMVGAVSDEITR
jgi:putative ABC transport system substrate-binding protein